MPDEVRRTCFDETEFVEPGETGFFRTEDAMTRYTVDVVWDDPATLRNMLHQIGEDGGRVVNVLWLPQRIVETDDSSRKERAGYTIISEFQRDGAAPNGR